MKLVKRTIESNFLLDDYESLKIQELEMKLVGDVMNRLNETLEVIVREYSVPPIKGEITKGKLTWRGLRLCSSPMILGNTRYWIEQRGKQIGYQIIFKPLDIK